eukprot:6100611-Prymnesium_polylepis.1
MAAETAMHASEPSTTPKQWYNGTGMHTRSSGPSTCARCIACPLLTNEWLVSATALGSPVVPDVN